MAKTRFFKLNPESSIFFSPASELKVLPGQVVRIEARRIKHDDRVKMAISNGHIVEVQEKDWKNSNGIEAVDLCIERPGDEPATTEVAAASTSTEEETEDEDDDEEETEDEDDDEEEEETKTNTRGRGRGRK